MKMKITLMGLLIILWSHFAFGQYNADLATMTPGDILQISFDHFSTEIKAEYRAYLAEKYANTPEGLFSRAWLADYDGDSTKGQSLYRQCHSEYPDFLYCTWNLQGGIDIDKNTAERIALLEEIIEKDPAFYHSQAIPDLYRIYLFNLENEAAASKFLARMEAKHTGNPMIDVMHHWKARKDKNFPLAAQYLQKVITNPDTPIDVCDQLVWLNVNHLAKGTEDINARLAFYQPYIDFIKTHKNKREVAEALLRYGDEMYEQFQVFADAYSIYDKSWQVYPTSDAALSTFKALERLRPGEAAIADLETKFHAMPQSWGIAELLGAAYTSKKIDVEKARRYFHTAEMNTHTKADRESVQTMEAAWLVEKVLFDYDGALAVYDRLFREAKTKKRDYLYYAYLNRLQAMDFPSAKRALEKYIEYCKATDYSLYEGWIIDSRMALDRYRSNQENRDDYYLRHPFQKSWDSAFGYVDKIVLDLDTAGNVLPGEKIKLKTLAGLMQDSSAHGYTFIIEGHADDQGSPPANEQESQKLADFVKETFIRQYRVSPTALHTVAMGDKVPPATAQSASNRRVEITYLTEEQNPTLAATPAMKALGKLSLAPDGRSLVTGYPTLQLWDIKRAVRTKVLGLSGYEVTYSPSGRLVATNFNWEEIHGYDTNAMIVYDTKTGFPLIQLPHMGEIMHFVWDPTGTKIAFINRVGKLFILDILKNKLTRVIQAASFHIGGKLLWTKDGQYIVAGIAQEKVLKVWNAADLTLARELPGVDWPHALGETGDGKYLICQDNKHQLTVWDRDSWQSRVMTVNIFGKQIQAHPTDPVILINDINPGEKKLAMVDVAKMQIIGAYPTQSKYNRSYTEFTPDGQSILVGEEDEITILHYPSLRITGHIASRSKRALSAMRDRKEGKYFFSHDKLGIHVWDVEKGVKIHTWKGVYEDIYQPENNAGFLLAVPEVDESEPRQIVELDFRNFTQRVLLTLPYDVKILISDGAKIIVAGVPYQDEYRQTQDKGILEVYSLKTLQRTMHTDFALVTESLKYPRLYDSGFSALTYNPEKNIIAYAGRWMDGNGHEITRSKYIKLVDAQSGKEIGSHRFFNDIYDLDFPADRTGQIAVLTQKNTTYLDIQDFKQQDTSPYGSQEKVIKLTNWPGEIIWSQNYLSFKDPSFPGGEKTSCFNDLVGVQVYEDKNLLIALLGTNEILYFSLAECRHYLTIINKDGDEWLAYAPGGEFMGSLNGTDNTFWAMGEQFVELAAFRDQYENPQVIKAQIDKIQNGQSVSTTQVNQEPPIARDIFLPPYQIMLLSAAEMQTSEDTYVFRLQIRKTAAVAPDPQVEFTNNGRCYHGEKGGGFAALVSANSDIYEYKIALAPGINVIQSTLLYQGIRIEPRTAVVSRSAKATSGLSAAHLWYFAVGISKYSQADQSLDFANKDVMSVAQLLQKQEGRLYRKVHTKILTDENATAREIRIQMNEFLRQAAEQDVIVIFLSGHGAQDIDQTLYFITYDADLYKPFTGLDIDVFHKLLNTRPANQKAIFWIDICHAGAVQGQGMRAKGNITVNEAIKEIAQGTGIYVLASSTGRESSLESASFNGGHGAFTAALLEALEGNADAVAGDRNGFVSITELHNYVARRVTELTRSLQHPTVPRVSGFQDFPITQSQQQ